MWSTYVSTCEGDPIRKSEPVKVDRARAASPRRAGHNRLTQREEPRRGDSRYLRCSLLSPGHFFNPTFAEKHVVHRQLVA
jgi:hypothetical protein